MTTVFTTSKGSVYTIHNEGRTQRYKTVKQKQYPESDLTVYLDQAEARWVTTVLSMYGWFEVKEGKLYSTHVVLEKFEREIPFSNTPKIGLTPFEIWKPFEHPHSVHIGHEIDNIM